MTPIQILYVHHGKGIGGAPLSLLYLIRGLDRARFTPTVFCLHESEAAELFRREGIETIVDTRITDFSHTNVLWYPWWQLPKILLRLLRIPTSIDRAYRFLQKREFDIVHLNTSTLLAFGIAAKRLGKTVVWHVREPIAEGYFGWRKRFVRNVIDKNADIIIPICRYDGSKLIPTDRIKVVYNFVDFAVFYPSVSGEDVRTELGLAPDRKLVLMLGGINAVKGTETLVSAAEKVLKRHPGTVFAVAGEVPQKTLRNILNARYPYARSVLEAAAQLPSGSLRFLGVRNDIPRLIAACDMLCFPSTVPHFARPVIEAAAMGKPVVASDLGGPQELVLPGETGLLVPPNDSAALADALIGLLSDAEKRTAMGNNAHEFARVHFDAVKNTRQVIDLYEELAGEASN